MKKLKSAVAGCGNISSKHFDYIAESEKTELTAVCDIVPEKSDSAAQKYSAKAYYDFDKMLSDADFDVLHICTPHYLHAEMAIKAMSRNKHVLCEKPLAITYEDALKMCECARKNSVYLGVCFQNRYNYTSAYTKKLLKSGEMGQILGIKAFLTWDRDEKYYSDDWHGTIEKEGGGVVINQAIHTIDLIQWFADSKLQNIKSSISQKRLLGKVETEDTADALITFENGIEAVFFATLGYCENSPVHIEIACENGKITLDDNLYIQKNDTPAQKIETEHLKGEKSYWGSSHGLLLDDFYSSIISNIAFAIDGEQGINAVKITDELYKYARSK